MNMGPTENAWYGHVNFIEWEIAQKYNIDIAGSYIIYPIEWAIQSSSARMGWLIADS